MALDSGVRFWDWILGFDHGVGSGLGSEFGLWVGFWGGLFVGFWGGQ